jgi:hypothetical protein
METPQHLFALTRSEQRIVLLIVLGLLLGSAFSYYHKAESNLSPAAQTHAKPDSKPSADENPEDE